MRLRIFKITLIAGFVLLLAGLFYMQIIKGLRYANLSESNRIRLVPIEGLRGTIYDRNGEAIVNNRLSFDIVAIPQEMTGREATFRKLSDILQIPQEDLKERYKENYIVPFAPVCLVRDVEKEKAITVESHKVFLPGITIQTRPMRNYVRKDMACHLLGFLGEIDREELNAFSEYGYKMRDQIGRSGVERYYDTYLRAESGGMQVEVDNRGRSVKVLGIKEPKRGLDIQLTIDWRVQKYLDDALSGHTGAAIVMDSQTGEVIALSSAPGFDPNVFVRFDEKNKVRSLLKDRSKPLLNRAISGLYPPGSTFKIITAAAALDSQKITPNNEFTCPGYYHLGNRTFNCWNPNGHGSENLKGGLVHSCNVYFFNLGRLAGADNIANMASVFELGRRTGIDLPGESRGFVPTKKWKKEKYALPWFEGDTLNFAIGQGYLMLTPVQMVRAINAVANGGYLVQPILVKKIGDVEVASPRYKRIALSARILSAIKDGLDWVVEDPTGTGARAKLEDVRIGAKTGTAQTPKGMPHAWFMGYAPRDNPKVSFVIFLEYGGSGGGIIPATIIRDLVKKLKECKII
ncbi:MAG: penicillin-binding protein 2 [Candidatus Omnitrophota bacterium]